MKNPFLCFNGQQITGPPSNSSECIHFVTKVPCFLYDHQGVQNIPLQKVYYFKVQAVEKHQMQTGHADFPKIREKSALWEMSPYNGRKDTFCQRQEKFVQTHITKLSLIF